MAPLPTLPRPPAAPSCASFQEDFSVSSTSAQEASPSNHPVTRQSCTAYPGDGRMVCESLPSKGWGSGFCRIITAFPVTPSGQLSHLPTNNCGAYM